VKQLFSDDEQEFMKEVSILKAVGPKNHPHLIKLLATYKHKKKYHLLFPYAKANLRTYWEEHKMPAFDRPTLLWSLKQMEGIASGLNLIHNFSVTYPLSVSGAGKPGDDNVRLPKDAKLSVKKGEEMYGRHGDIKPENVLWFADEDNESGSVMGTLQIADFGLGRFHGRDSRSGIPAYGIFSSPTYEPPECKLHLPVSRAYDIWSLGCIYLEFVTWLLEGSAQIDGFANFRGRIATATGINDDNFFTVITNIQGSRAVVRESVVTWSNRLHSHPKCTEVLHDLLDFIMKDLLVVESKDRCNASILFQHLTWFRTRAEKDDKYLLEPVPRQAKPRGGRHNSTGAIDIAPRLPKRTSIQFSEGEKRGPKPKDLVQRNAGTPKPNLGHPMTWPDQRMDE
jgi:serine/threonine protein kinase